MRKQRALLCKFDGCTMWNDQGGYCWGHTKQLQRGEALRPLFSRWVNREAVCISEKCNNKQATSTGLCRVCYQIKLLYKIAEPHERKCEYPSCKLKHAAKGLCAMHYSAARLINKANEISNQVDYE